MAFISQVQEILAGINTHTYSAVGDITVMGLSLLLFILLIQTYIHRDRSFVLLIGMLVTACVTSVSSIVYHSLMQASVIYPPAIYIFRSLRLFSMSVLLYLSVVYLQEPLWISAKSQRHYKVMPLLIAVLCGLLDILGTITHYGFYVETDGTVHSSFNVYTIAFMMIVTANFYLLIYYRGRTIRQVSTGLLCVNALAIMIMAIQGIHGQSSFTSIACFLPVIGIFYMFHANPFDLKTGAASDSYLLHALDSARDHNRPLVIMTCLISGFSRALEESKEFRTEYYQFFRQNVRKGIVYRVDKDRLILTFPKVHGEQQKKSIEKILEDFTNCHVRFKLDYRIIVMETTPDIQNSADYIRIIQDIELTMPINGVHYVDELDLEHFYGGSYILSELEDISRKKDLNDERVLVYCQPVYNIVTHRYDTAEALMRLRLPKTGMTPPDQFIPIAEQYNHIHTLSMIILNKTCAAVRSMIEQGVEFKRVSVNFSTLDLRYDSFSEEVQSIIMRNQIPFNKIAIEITESRNEADFHIMKEKVEQLQKLGIKFYLDDFGTGYSNFERIMEIPFDIIKFDRSLTIESGRSESSYYMVSTFASMFSTLRYAVLFEGIEDEKSEDSCVQMGAQYLQGYKYSKPIPIEDLAGFLTAKAS